MRIIVIGPGRAGTAIHQHARAAGLESTLTREPAQSADAEIALLAVPDRALADVARRVPPGPALGMLSGSVPLADLPDRTRRFCLHPMQTIQPDRDALQLTGCAAGITAEDEDTAALARTLALRLGMHPIDVPEAARPLPHIACVFASNLLAPALAAACAALRTAGLENAPAQLLGPLAHRAVDNALAGAAPTGPVARGDAETVRAHRARLAAADPSLERAYVQLSSALLPLVPAASAARCAPLLEAAP